MRARLLVVLKIASQNPPQRRLVPHNDVIQALAPNRSDQSFHIWILPRRSRRRHHFFDPHALSSGQPLLLQESHLYPVSDTLALPRERLLASAALFVMGLAAHETG